MKRLGLVLATLVASAVALTGGVLLWDFDSPELGQAIVSRARDATGVGLQVRSYSLVLARGLEFAGVAAAAEIPGGRYRLDLEQLVFRHRLMPLLRGTVAIDQILLGELRLELVSTGVGNLGEVGAGDVASAAAGGLGATWQPSLDIREITIRDAVVELSDETAQAAPTSFEGLSLVMRDLTLDPSATTPMGGFSATGEFEVERIGLESTEVRNAHGGFRLADGVFQTREVTFTTPEGGFSVEISAELSRVPFAYTIALTGDPLDLDAAAGTDGFGAARFELDGQGVGPESKGLRAEGSVDLEEGTFPEHPTILGIEAAVGSTLITGESYEAVHAVFHIADDRLLLEPFTMRSAEFALRIGGAMGLDTARTLNLSVQLEVPREGIVVEGVTDSALNTLADERGWLSIPLRITGPAERPRVRPDTKALLGQAGRGLGRSLGRTLQGLFGPDE